MLRLEEVTRTSDMNTTAIIYDRKNTQVTQEGYDRLIEAMEYQAMVICVLQEEIIKFSGKPISESTLTQVNLN